MSTTRGSGSTREPAPRPAAKVPILIRHPSEAFRRGLALAIDHGIFEVAEQPASLEAWLRGTGPRVLAVYVAGDEGWQELEMGIAARRIVTMAMLKDLDPRLYRRALAAKADGVVHADIDPTVIAHCLSATLVGEIVLPIEVVRSMAIDSWRDSQPTVLNDEEIRLLSKYAAGATVHDLSRDEYFGERTIRRRMQNICLKLGTKTRAEAVARASHLGLIG
jgi:DNA-binding NarL/FixJ family response regulator